MTEAEVQAEFDRVDKHEAAKKDRVGKLEFHRDKASLENEIAQLELWLENKDRLIATNVDRLAASKAKLENLLAQASKYQGD